MLLQLNVVRDDGAVNYSVDKAAFAGYANGKALLYAPGDAVLTVSNVKGYSVQIPLHSNLSNQVYWGEELKDTTAPIIMDSHSSQHLVLTYSDATGVLPVPSAAYVLTASPAGLLTLTKGESAWTVASGSQKGTGTLHVKMGSWVDKDLGSVIVADNVPSGDTEPFDESDIVLD